MTDADFIHFPTEQQYAHIWDAFGSSDLTDISEHGKRPYTYFRPGKMQTFPAGLQGFLYYYMQHGPAPAIAGEIRFRVTHGSSPIGFNNGYDLKSAHGLPWRLELLTIAAYPDFNVFRDILLRDELVSEQTMILAATLGRERRTWASATSLVHSFGQPWYLDLGSRTHWWHFMGADRLQPMQPFSNILSWKTGEHRLPSPWLGASIRRAQAGASLGSTLD